MLNFPNSAPSAWKCFSPCYKLFSLLTAINLEFGKVPLKIEPNPPSPSFSEKCLVDFLMSLYLNNIRFPAALLYLPTFRILSCKINNVTMPSKVINPPINQTTILILVLLSSLYFSLSSPSSFDKNRKYPNKKIHRCFVSLWLYFVTRGYCERHDTKI